MWNHRKPENIKYYYSNLWKKILPTQSLCVLGFVVVLFAASPTRVFAQEEQPETVVKVVKYDSINYHSPRKATIYSAILPGLGQAYNKKYWKIPIIYAGFGTLIYFISVNGTEYRSFKEAYNIVATGDSANFNNEYVQRYDANLGQLKEGRNYYRRNLQLNYILSGLLYLLNIVDASVDANLYNFDVSDDITLHFEPVRSDNIFIPKPSVGLTLRYRF